MKLLFSSPFYDTFMADFSHWVQRVQREYKPKKMTINGHPMKTAYILRLIQ